MKHSTGSTPPSAHDDGARPVCPSCHSTATVTTAAKPDVATYWRCTECGDVWNVARSQTNRRAPRWR
jgi:transposase-like protein